jgi:selenocysteine lyase/cysteine desulfurase
LHKQNIIISLRQGRLRVSPHFYNTEEEVKKLMVGLFE